MKSTFIPLVLMACALLVGGCKRQSVPAKPTAPEPAAQAASPTDTTTLPADLRSGLVLYYDFNMEPVGGKIPDLSGHGNDGQAVGIQWVANGHQGGAVLFGLTNGYITVPNNDSINPPNLTLSAWIQTSYQDWVWRRIFDKGVGKGYDLTMGGDYKGKSYRGQVYLELPHVPDTHTRMKVTDGNWHHVVGTYDGAVAKVYVDGWPMGPQGHWEGAVPNSPYDLTIGANRSNPDPAVGEVDASFNGMMDDVMMFNRALSADEVQALFKFQGGMLGPEPEPPPPPRSTAQNRPRGGDGPWNHRILLAHSTDGLSWTVDAKSLAEKASVPELFTGPAGRPLLLFVDAPGESVGGTLGALAQDSSGNWERVDTNLRGADPDVVRLANDDFRAYTKNFDGSIQASESKDGLQWSFLGAAFQDDRYPNATDPDVFQTGDGWVMLVSLGSKLLVCTSPDGLKFTAGKIMDLGGSVSGTVKVSGGWRTYFHVNPNPNNGWKMDIHSAFTADGRVWNVEEGVRVSAPGEGAASLGVADPSPLQLPDGTWLMAIKSFIQPPSFMGAPPPAGTPPKAGAADRLKQLKDLLDQGLINQDQYDQKRKEILDSL